MSQENKYQKKPIIEDPPETFLELTKRVLNLDDYISTQPSIKKLGEYAIFLNNQKKKSIYKKLLSKDSKSKISFQEMKEIRNKYLKKLVESNSFYFPKELGLDEYKKPTNSKEEKIKQILEHLEEIAKKERNNIERSRKNSSTNLMASRKESILENKRNRSESLEIEQKKVKKLEENEENEENGENGEEANGMEENDGEASYAEEENYAHPDDDDSQNYNYSYGENDEGDDY